MKTLIFVLLAAVLTACGGSGGGSPSVAASPAPSGPQTKQMTLQHGQGFACWISDLGDQLWCWATDPISLTDGTAAKVGLTSIVPVVVATNCAGCIHDLQIEDHQIMYAGGIYVAGFASGTSNSFNETLTCTVTSADSVHCPYDSVGDLTFSGLTQLFADFTASPDVQVPHYPHSFSWYHSRRTA
jgi:hypothetical protein